MSDTLPDPPAPEQASKKTPRPKQRRLASAGLVLLALASVGGVAFYFLFVRYVPVAASHVPANANLVVRVDFRAIALFPPVRKHLLPAKPSTASKRLRELTHVDPTFDLREVLFATVDGTSYVLILGGTFSKGAFVRGVEAYFKEQGETGWGVDGDIVVGPGGIAAAQADDGTLLLGSDRAIVTTALAATDDESRIGVPEASAVGFAITHRAWEGALGKLLPKATFLGRVEQATGTFHLGAQPALHLRVTPQAGQDAAALARDLDQTLAELRVVALLAPDVAGEQAALGGARVRTDHGVVLLEAPWPLEGIDRGCAHLAPFVDGRRSVLGLFGR